MTLSEFIPIIVGVLYTIQGVILLADKQYGFAIMWGAYALANLGLIIAQSSSTDTTP